MKYEPIGRRGIGRMRLRTPTGLRRQVRDCKVKRESQQIFQFGPKAALNCIAKHKQQCMDLAQPI
jgi:hypothetical protein